MPSSPRQQAMIAAAGRGAVSGLAGVLAMTVSEKLEQRLTGRPDSYVPARALLRVVGQPAPQEARPATWNHAMHWGTGALVGALRGVWSAVGIRGPQATATHTVVRLAVDQTVENVSGVGAPPATWPPRERAVDYAHKAVYATVTGWVADRWIQPTAQVERGRASQ